MEFGLVALLAGIAAAFAGGFIDAIAGGGGLVTMPALLLTGVPPHMAGDTEKSTSWGSGLEQQSQGFVSYTLDDWLTEWEESLAAALLGNADDQYFKFTRASLVRPAISSETSGFPSTRVRRSASRSAGSRLEALSSRPARRFRRSSPLSRATCIASKN